MAGLLGENQLDLWNLGEKLHGGSYRYGVDGNRICDAFVIGIAGVCFMGFMQIAAERHQVVLHAVRSDTHFFSL
jgi:hypothetical protein